MGWLGKIFGRGKSPRLAEPKPAATPEVPAPEKEPDERDLWRDRKIEFSELSSRLQEIGRLVARVAAAGSAGDADLYEKEARRAASGLEPAELDELPVFFLNQPPPPPEADFETPRVFGVWMSACQRAVVEIAAQMGEPGRAWLRELAFAPYDWPQVDAVIRLLDLVETGEYPVEYLVAVSERLEHWLDSQWEPVLERLESWQGPLPDEAVERLESFCGVRTLTVARICRRTRPALARDYAARMLESSRSDLERKPGHDIGGEGLVDLLGWFPEAAGWIESEMAALVDRALRHGTPSFLQDLEAIAGSRPELLEPVVPLLVDWVRGQSTAGTASEPRESESVEALEILRRLEPPGVDSTRLAVALEPRLVSSYWRDRCRDLSQTAE